METEARTLMASWDTPCAGSRVGGPPLRSTEGGGKSQDPVVTKEKGWRLAHCFTGCGQGGLYHLAGVSAAHFLRCYSAFLFT